MTWWTEQSGKAIQIKQKSRFIVEISSGFFLPNVKSCSKPSANVEIKEYQLINHIFKYPGIVKWNDIKISMIDMAGTTVDYKGFDKKGQPEIDPNKPKTLDTSILLWRMLKHTGYNFPTEVDEKRIALTGTPRDLTTPEKASTIANAFGKGLTGAGDFGTAGVGLKSNKQSVRIYQLDPNAFIVEEWVLHNPQIKSINWGDLSYEDDAPVEYTLDICYDWAQLIDKTNKNRKLSDIGSKYEEFMTKYFDTYNK